MKRAKYNPTLQRPYRDNWHRNSRTYQPPPNTTPRHSIAHPHSSKSVFSALPRILFSGLPPLRAHERSDSRGPNRKEKHLKAWLYLHIHEVCQPSLGDFPRFSNSPFPRSTTDSTITYQSRPEPMEWRRIMTFTMNLYLPRREKEVAFAENTPHTQEQKKNRNLDWRGKYVFWRFVSRSVFFSGTI